MLPGGAESPVVVVVDIESSWNTYSYATVYVQYVHLCVRCPDDGGAQGETNP